MYETKEAVLQSRILSRIQQNTPKLEDIVANIRQDGMLLQDHLVPSKLMSFEANGRVYTRFQDTARQFTDFSLGQMAEKVGVPVKYINQLSGTSWGRQLAATIFNEHTNQQPNQTFLIRETDGNVRGVLSDRYKIMDSMEIFMAFLSGALGAGAKLYDGLYTDSKNYLEVVFPEMVPIQTPNNGVVHVVIGARVRNSDFGDGALSLRVFILNVRCLNGMVGEQLLREVHLGGRIQGLQQFLSFETIRKETSAQAAIIGDTMKGIFSGEHRQREIERILVASDKVIDMQQEIKTLPKMGIHQDEIKTLTEKLLNNDPDDGIQGKNTVWKLVQGLTSVANEQQPARARELQEIASTLY